VRDHSTAMVYFVQKCNWLESYIFRQISAKVLPKTKSSTVVEI